MKLKIGDIIIILFFVISSTGIFLSHTLSRVVSDDMMVEVVIEREVVDRIPLNQNLEKTYTSELGSNTIVIEDGKIHVHDADCNDKICVNTKEAQYAGDAIVCLPNRFSVEIIGDLGGEVDAISE